MTTTEATGSHTATAGGPHTATAGGPHTATAGGPHTAAAGGPPEPDLVGELAGLDEAISAARAAKPLLISRTAAAHEAYLTAPGRLDSVTRHALAARVAGQQGAPGFAAHHRSVPGVADLLSSWTDPSEAGDPATVALLRFADIASVAPALASPTEIVGLLESGYAPGDIVLVAQGVAMTSFEAHLISGLRLISGREPEQAPGAPRDVPDRGKRHPEAAPNGALSPAGFTTDALGWEPWVEPIGSAELTAEQRAAFASKPEIPYFRLLARQPGILVARTDVDDAIFESGLDTEGALPQAERELLAAVTSRVNDCIFCASVHARRAVEFSKRAEEIKHLLLAPVARESHWQPGDLRALPAAAADERWAALISFGAALAATPPRAGRQQVRRLRELGFSDTALVDAVAAVAFFSWANRLMLTLGEPYLPGTRGERRNRA